jgi:lysozyme
MSWIARFHRRAFFLSLVAALLAAGCDGEPAPPADPSLPADAPPAVTPPPPVDTAAIAGRVHQGGFDVSWHSGAIDWPAVVADGPGFVILKATEGVDLKDAAFDDHWPAVREAGLVRGAYHFYVTEDDPQEQARFFIANVVLEPGDLAPVVDVEVLGHGTQPGLADRLRTFIGIVEEHYGVRPFIYTSPKFWDQHLDDTFGGYPLWIAEYGVEAPTVPAGWETWTLWQWMGDADVKGVEKGADLSRAHPELADAHLEALVVGRALTRSRPLM